MNRRKRLFWQRSRLPVIKPEPERIASVAGGQPLLERFSGNPILEPLPDHSWESQAVFNPAAVLDDNRIHVIYRAVGDANISTLGYASSHDGVHITERLDDPVYRPRETFEGVCECQSKPYSRYASGGGGEGGCEDPRISSVGDRLYMTYVAYNGWGPPRVAMTSISKQDFRTKNWFWTKPVLISRPDIVDKNACILSEKINGRYCIFHRVYPNILIDFVDDLEFDGCTRWLKGEFRIGPRPTHWDSRKIGAGPPPLKTDRGWLLVYHAVGEQAPNRYKVGAMLLDLKDPTVVLARCERPIFEPYADYEFCGEGRGIVYPCGAVVKEGRLFVYYGAADRTIGVAYAELDEFLDKLIDMGTKGR